MKKELLEIRKKKKSKKPEFISQDSWKRKRIRKRWQRPKGFQSKMRLTKKGYRKLVSTGYGSPKEVYGLDISGLEKVTVNNLSDLNKIDKEAQGALISGKVGNKKRMEIINKAKELGITVLNFKDTEKFVKKVEEDMKNKKEKKTKRLEKKKATEKKKAPKKEEKKEAEKTETTEDTKKETEKKEKDKLLTKQTK